MNTRINRLTWAQRFLLASLVILGIGMAGIGAWVGQEIETGVVHRTAGTTAMYVDSVVAPELQELATSETLRDQHVQALNELFDPRTPFGQQIVSFKVWNKEGEILYSTNPALIGQVFPIEGGLAEARRGQVSARVSPLELEENVAERLRGKPLLEVYSPVRRPGSPDVIAVAEFYQSVDELEGEIARSQQRSWLVVGAATLGMYLLLAGFVRRASNTISRQQGELGAQVQQLQDLVDRNAELDERVRRAAARTTALNERILRRISAELHDGPAQELGLALLRLDHILARVEARLSPTNDSDADQQDLDAIQNSIQHALHEVRAISTGMGVPQLENLSPADIVSRVVRNHERRTSTPVQVQLDALPTTAPLSVKITLYRIIQEALANAYRHAQGKGQQVHVSVNDGQLLVSVADAGPGFATRSTPTENGHLGLVGMRERVESLGGTFEIESEPGRGTRISARVPLQSNETLGEP